MIGQQPQTGAPLRDRFTLIRRLETTELSTVELARDLLTGRLAVVKRVREQAGAAAPFARMAFQREQHALRRLRHRQIPRLLDAWSDSTGSYLAIEHIDGVTLEALLNSSSLRRSQRLAIAHELCAAVAVLHHQSPPLIHADIKPANIMVARDGRVVLIDFGLSRECGQGPLGPAAGTPGYTPYEQWRGEILDERADIYALSQVLRDLLESASLSAELSRLLLRASAPERAERLASVEPLLGALPRAEHASTNRWSALGVLAQMLLLLLFVLAGVGEGGRMAHMAVGQITPTPALRITLTPSRARGPAPARSHVDAAVATVRKYQQARATAIARQDLTVLAGLATDDVIAQVGAIVEEQRGRGALMQINVAELTILKIDIIDERRVAVVVEKLEGQLLFPAGCHVPDDQQPCRADTPVTVRGKRYHVRYLVVYRNPGWMISAAVVE